MLDGSPDSSSRENSALKNSLDSERGISVLDAEGLEVGCAVLVPFGHRSAVGFVVGIVPFAPGDSFPEDIKPTQLKEIKKVLSKPYFTEIGARCAAFMAERYIEHLFHRAFVCLCHQAAFLGLSTLKAPGS